MISYAPFGDDEVKVSQQVPARKSNKPSPTKDRRTLDEFLGDDNTECNYLVMFFCIGRVYFSYYRFFKMNLIPRCRQTDHKNYPILSIERDEPCIH